MARISTYATDGTIVDGDKVIGSDANNDLITKNYRIGDLVAYFAVAIGDYLVPYVNATSDVNLGQYSLLASNLELTDEIVLNGSSGLPGQVIISQGNSAPAQWGYIIGSQNLQNVLEQGNIGLKSIILNTVSKRFVADIDGIHDSVPNVFIQNKTTGDIGKLYPTRVNLNNSALNKSSNYGSSSIIFSDGSTGQTITINAANYNNQTLSYPNGSGAFVLSVNGEPADISGNISLNIPTPGTAVWGDIIGTLSDQDDLQGVLDSKFNTPSGTTSQYVRGDGSLDTFPTIPTVTPSALTKVDDTNVTLTLGGSPSTALLASTSLTLGWTGTLADSRIASASTWNAKLSDAPSDGATYGRKNGAWSAVTAESAGLEMNFLLMGA